MQSEIVVVFTPRVPLNFNSNYDIDTDCAHLTWSPVESGKCKVTYEVKYFNPYDGSVPDEVHNTQQLSYKKCGTDVGKLFLSLTFS